MGRVLSPNDIYYQFDPWASHRQLRAQNPLIYDPPVSYFPVISLLREDPSSFHWNRYVAAGIAGYGSAAAAVLSPFIALPGLLLPLTHVYLGIVVFKIMAGFVLAYWWLREERLGRRGAAVGALLFSVAGPYMVWWLWQSTNATVLYPAVLLCIRRVFHGKRNSMVVMTIIIVALLLSGFPAAIAYLAYLSIAYLIFLAVRYRTVPWMEIGKGTGALGLGLMIAAPFLAPLVTFLNRSGYFSVRKVAGYDFHYPAGHLRGFIDPFRLGNPSEHFWLGDPRLAISNNFVEATVYVGLLALVLVPLGVFAPRAKHRWFWLAALLLLLLCMFGGHLALTDAIGELPGIRYSPLTRLRILLPLPVAYLSAAAVSMLVRMVRFRGRKGMWGRDLIAAAIGLVMVVDLARVAGHFYPSIELAHARLPRSQTIDYLKAQPGIFRIAPFFNYLVPNTSQLAGLEDIRSHFGSEQRYRDLLRRFDPEGWGGTDTVILFNSLKANLADPVLSMCNVRFLVEPPAIDIVRWRILEKSEISGRPSGELRLRSGQTLTRELYVDSPDLYAIDLDFPMPRARGRNASVIVELVRPETGKTVVRRSWSASWLESHPKVYVPTWPHAGEGNVLLLRIRANEMDVNIPTIGRTEPQPLLWGKVKSPVIPATEFSDGRLFENLTALPRYWAVWNVRRLSDAELLTAPVDFAREAIVAEEPADGMANLSKVVPWLRRVEFRVLRYSAAHQVIETNSQVPFLLSTSEKLTPELEVRLDGAGVSPLQINGLFTGVRVRPGRHRIELTRRIGRGWWAPSFAALLICMATQAFDRIRRRRAQRDAD